MLKLFLYGYQNRVSSSRALEREAQRNIEVIWLLQGLRPGHKTLSDFGKHHGEQIREALRQFSWFLKKGGYLDCKEVSIDGMRLKANTNRDTLSEEKIDKRLGKLDKQISYYIEQLKANGAIEDKEEKLELLALEEKQANADSGYYNIEAIEDLQALGKQAYTAVSEAGQKKAFDEQGQPIEFAYDKEKDEYRCSQGRELKLLSKGVTKNGRKMNQYRSKDCSGCPVRQACTSSKIGRTVCRHENAEWLEAYKRKMGSPQGKAMLSRRRCTVEHPFGTIRNVMMGYTPILLRGRSKVQTEIDLYHFGYNLKRVCNIAGIGVVRYLVEQYDWKAAAEEIKRADEQRKKAEGLKKAA